MSLPRLKEGWTARGDLPDIAVSPAGDMDLGLLDEDLLQVIDPSGRLTLDAGWYPAGDADGQFICQLIYLENWDEPLDEIQTKDSSEVISWIEDWISRTKDVLGEDGEISEGMSVLVPVYVVTEPPALVSGGPTVAPPPRPSSVASQYLVTNRANEQAYAA